MSEERHCIHLVFRAGALAACLDQAHPGDAVVLLDDATGALLHWRDWLPETEGLVLACMNPDLQARGGAALLLAGNVDRDVLAGLDYTELVDWVCRWPLSLSWS